MSEHQVVVVFDITAETREEAARRIAEMYRRGSVHRGNLHAYGVESWWFPEADLKHIDGNDNDAGRLVFDPPSPNLFVQDDADDEPTVWLHRPHDPEHPLALLCPGNLGRQGRELLWDYIVRDLPTEPPAATA